MPKSNGRMSSGRPRQIRFPEMERSEFLKHATGVALRKDMVTLLTDIKDRKIIGTQSTGNMTLKCIRELTAKFVDPPILDRSIGEKEYKLRTEEEVWPLHFLRILGDVANFISTPKGKHWRLKKAGKEFLEYDSIQQVILLLHVWWFQTNWLVAYPFTGMGDELPADFPMVALSHVANLPVDTDIDYPKFADALIDAGGLTWASADKTHHNSMLRGAVKNMVINIMEKFDAVECHYQHEPVGATEIKQLTTFKLTVFGQKLLQALVFFNFGQR